MVFLLRYVKKLIFKSKKTFEVSILILISVFKKSFLYLNVGQYFEGYLIFNDIFKLLFKVEGESELL